MDLTEKIILFTVAIVLVIVISSASYNRKDKVRYLKDRYDSALKGKDKAAAWGAGREYYSHLNGGKLNQEIEDLIATDIAAIMDES